MTGGVVDETLCKNQLLSLSLSKAGSIPSPIVRLTKPAPETKLRRGDF